jgi:hypothetical protein
MATESRGRVRDRVTESKDRVRDRVTERTSAGVNLQYGESRSKVCDRLS